MKQTFTHTCHIERGRERETGRQSKREIYIGRERIERKRVIAKCVRKICV